MQQDRVEGGTARNEAIPAEGPSGDISALLNGGQKKWSDRPSRTFSGALRLLTPLAGAYKWQLTVGVLAMVLSSGMMLALGWGLKEIVDRGFRQGDTSVLNSALVFLAIVIAVLAGASYARLQIVYRVAERIIADLRKKIFAHLITLDPAWFDTHKTGDQIAKINADTTVLQLVITSNLPSTFRHALMLLGGMIMLFLVSPDMTLKALIAVPAIILPAIYFGRRVRAKSRDTQSRIGDISSYAQETLQGLQTIQSFGYEPHAAVHFSGLADDAYHAALKYILLRAALASFVIAAVFGAIGLLLWAGGHRVLEGSMTGGDLSAFIFYAAVVAGAVTAISEAMSDLSRAAGAADRITDVLSAQPQIKFRVQKKTGIENGDMAFDHVTFFYPSRPQQPALENVSFQVRRGETVALIGPSGAGKTTVFQLLQRFYDPQQGRVRIGGADIVDHAPEDVRKLFGVVAQDSVIFSLSVAENIRMGNPSANDDAVRRAAQQAQAHEFITQLPQGYDTRVGERGNRLSGGQRQRIAIARALLKDPQILLLDEATSALDSASEQAVHAALKTLMQGRTTLIIAHRLSTVQGADRVILLDQGRLVAEGKHADLFRSSALYAHLAGLQTQKAS